MRSHSLRPRSTLLLAAALIVVACTDKFWCPDRIVPLETAVEDTITGCCVPSSSISADRRGPECCSCTSAGCDPAVHRFSPAPDGGSGLFVLACAGASLDAGQYLVLDYACNTEQP